MRLLVPAAALAAFVFACSSNDTSGGGSGNSSGSSGSSGSGSANGSSGSSGGDTSSGSSGTTTTTTEKYSCKVNGTCYKCPNADAERKCFSDPSGCSVTEPSYCN